MLNARIKLIFFLCLLCACSVNSQQVVTLKEAVETAVKNYGTIKAKSNYAAASNSLVEQVKRDYFPNVNFGLQQVYGTINGQNGPLYGFGLTAASSGLPLPEQNWNAAFGALYLSNINWDFFAFGRAKQRVKVAEAVAERDNKDLVQEIFQLQVRITGVYLNLLAAHQLTFSYRRNVERTDTLRRIVQTRALNGLVAGVDSSLANADYSSARILLTRAMDAEQQLKNELTQLLGTDHNDFSIDTNMVLQTPLLTQVAADSTSHPLIQLFRTRVELSNQQEKLIKKQYLPAFNLVGLFQTRASGFESGYANNQENFSKNYFDGIKPTRSNYLLGVGVTWNITQPFRLSKQLKAQEFVTKGLTDELNLASLQIKRQQELAENKIRNALLIYREAPVQMKAAADAYLQRSVLYRNGLSNLVDVAQASYALIRAETDRDIAINNIWQALLLKAAAAGDYSIFESQLQ